MAYGQSADIILRGGTVVDGLGSAPVVADVAIAGDRIVAVGALGGMTAPSEIDARGLAVAPGFIDVHTHDDLACLAAPEMTAKLSQGVTSVIVGNCGISATHLRFDAAVPEPFNLLGDADRFTFPGFADYAAAVDRTRPAVNVGALIGHSTLRLACMAARDRPAGAEEIAAMRALLADALRDGALGLSSGVFYSPARAADIAELRGLMGALAAAEAVYTAHIRDEYNEVAAALDEAFEIAGPDRVRLVISHHKCAGVQNWGRSVETLGLIDAARIRQPVLLDCYPYTAGSTIIRDDLADGKIEILINWSEPHPEMAGRQLADIAAEWGCDQPAAARRLAPGGASYFQIHEDDMRRIIAHDGCMIGSDGLPVDPLPHPRLWGTFPRVLGRYTRELGLFTLEQAVHRMTGLSAATFALADRGVIAPGMAADITVFDPTSVADTATYDVPQAIARGIDLVFVNGRLSWRRGEGTGTRAGRFLRRQPRAAPPDQSA
ncbi:N-acyl-D-amino-acid deacylase family protein [Sphingomonas flavalba]|uniref:N-acyl-D-amino-acid deacylase family protein n=1 Tax=Sphingomonas flavalba TaxID=2559804 RepID=UPI00109DAC31|nr:D-aminoacylase [Sphingomonas flavalba]